jgi:hypothetical protein
MVALRAAPWVVVVGILFPALPVAAGDGPRWHSEEWYEERAGEPPGTRQVYKYGKHWPPFSRPVGREQAFWQKYHTAHYWPHPYNCEDREFARSIIQQQTLLGWESATTLHDFHFHPETHRLNSAGENHLRWILTQAPVQYRTAYVARGMSEEVSLFRLAQVQEAARELSGSDATPVFLKYDSFLGRPAIEIDTLRRLELQAIPQPRLFTISGGAASTTGPSSSQAGGTTGTQGGN